MAKNTIRSGWVAGLIALGCIGTFGAGAASQSGRNLNPYHEQQLASQIKKCASGVLACSDAETKSLKQQELCQLLIRAERFDEAVQVAYNIYRAESAKSERQAVYHFMVAEIHSRKMKAAATEEAMESSRQSALGAAQQVLDQNYPAKWRVSEYARDLVRELSDSQAMAKVRQRVAGRQNKGDSTKEAIADAQRRYLDATQGSAPRTFNPPQDSAKFMQVVSDKPAPDASVVASAPMDSVQDMGISGMAGAPAGNRQPGTRSRSRSRSVAPETNSPQLPDNPRVTRVLSPMQTLTTAEADAVGRLGQAGLLTSQPGMAAVDATAKRDPVLVNGMPAKSSEVVVDDVVQNNLATLLEAARQRKAAERRSPYATGQLPSNMR